MTLQAWMDSSFHARRLTSLIVALQSSQDISQLLGAFRSTVSALGADAGIFGHVFESPGTVPQTRIFLVGSVYSFFEYAQLLEMFKEAGLEFSSEHAVDPHSSEPILEMGASTTSMAAETRQSFASTLVIPPYGGDTTGATGLLWLGSNTQGFFSGAACAELMVLGRSVSTSLQEWLDRRLQSEFLARTRLTREELNLLRLELVGMRAKAMARQLRTSPCSINSRFQRLNKRLGTHSRASSARLAAAHGLVPKAWRGLRLDGGTQDTGLGRADSTSQASKR